MVFWMVFVSSERTTGPHLNGKLAFVEGCVHLQHSDRQVTHAVQEWDGVVCIVLAIIRKCPWYHFFDAWQIQMPGTSARRIDKVQRKFAQLLSSSFSIHKRWTALQTRRTHGCSSLAPWFSSTLSCSKCKAGKGWSEDLNLFKNNLRRLHKLIYEDAQLGCTVFHLEPYPLILG